MLYAIIRLPKIENKKGNRVGNRNGLKQIDLN